MTDNLHLETRLSALMSQMRQQFNQALAAQGLELSPPQAQLLTLIGQEPGINGRQLAEKTGRDKATITRLLASLEPFLERRVDAADQRCQCLHLNAEGERRAAQVNSARRQAYGALFAPLGVQEKAQLAALLQKCLGREGETGAS
ncbi:MarR family transcriptional regulator [Gallaecimonas kandeliae]|uniref:MarR family winged helix-turn-helix transcriptional regulator n=1 Tax=Gallaecimonas kandeliae TaxID=3029055 RepID=UPI0026470ADD|nr:MarR family transcriptional regulator [Gallaecimonas kandeliae]WKE67095.1 MarR family transcriptional regulator [Gallaecimonas kandeliae]